MSVASASASRPVWLPHPPPPIDLAIAAVFVVLVVVEALVGGGPRPLWVHLPVATIAMAALAWRRQFPLVVALLVIAANLLLNPDGEFSTLLSLVLVSYTLGADARPPRNYLGASLLAITFVTASALEGLEPSDLAAALVFIGGPFAVGQLVRQRSDHAQQAVARADRLETEREEATRRAVAEERTRIARELHDIVSHSISVVAIQTQAVRRRLLPEQNREVRDLAAVEATARQALAEMRRLFGVLRADGESASLAPQPGLAELERLVAGADSAELPVRLVVSGTPYPLAPGVDLAAYRIAQEGLTNALRHSGASRVEVGLRYDPTQLEVTVTDDGPGLDGSRRDGSGGGHGLVGIRERVALYDGTVSLGAGPAGGTLLVARLPVAGPA
jgi:signal transduction histidine kinase